MAIEFPAVTSSVMQTTVPEVVAKPAVLCDNVRMANGQPITFRVTWSGGQISAVSGEWHWESGKWNEDKTVWTPGSAQKNHFIPNLLDPTFLAANPEVAVMVQVFTAMETVSKRAGVI